jgi:hypothetical protein
MFMREPMPILKKFLNLILILLVFISIALPTYIIFSNITLVLKPETLASGIIAFFGAFFAFAFVKFSDWISLIRKRNAGHFKALVLIERLLNQIVSRLDRNISLCKEDIAALRSMKMLIWNLPSVPYKYELANDLKNIDFINDYLTFTADIETLNHDINTIITMYQEIKSLFINKSIDPDTFKSNVTFSISRVSAILKFMEDYKSTAIELLAKNRILLKERKQKIFLIGPLPKMNYGKDLNTDLKKELSILAEEIEATKAKSQQEIDRIIKSR